MKYNKDQEDGSDAPVTSVLLELEEMIREKRVLNHGVLLGGTIDSNQES